MAIDPLGAGLGVVALVATTYQTCCQLWEGLQSMQSFPKDIRLLYRELQGQWAQVQQLMVHPLILLERAVDPSDPDDYVVAAVKGQMEALKTYFTDCNDILDKMFQKQGPQRLRSRPAARPVTRTSEQQKTTLEDEVTPKARGQNVEERRGHKSALNLQRVRSKLRRPWGHHSEVPKLTTAPTTKRDTSSGHTDNAQSTLPEHDAMVPKLVIDASEFDIVSSDDPSGGHIKSRVKQWRLMTWAHHDKEKMQSIIESIGRIVSVLKGLLSLRQMDNAHVGPSAEDHHSATDLANDDDDAANRGAVGENITVLVLRKVHLAMQYLNFESHEHRQFSISLYPYVTENRENLADHEQYFPLRRPGGVLWLQMHDREDDLKSTFLLLDISPFHDHAWLSALRLHFPKTIPTAPTPILVDENEERKTPDNTSLALVRFADPLSTAITTSFPPLTVLLKRYARKLREVEIKASKARFQPADRVWHIMGGDQHVGRWVLLRVNTAQNPDRAEDPFYTKSTSMLTTSRYQLESKSSTKLGRDNHYRRAGTVKYDEDDKSTKINSRRPILRTRPLVSIDRFGRPWRREQSADRSSQATRSWRSSPSGPIRDAEDSGNYDEWMSNSYSDSASIERSEIEIRKSTASWLSEAKFLRYRLWIKSDHPSAISDLDCQSNAGLSMLLDQRLGPCEAATKRSSRQQFQHWGLLPSPIENIFIQVVAETRNWHRKGTLKDILSSRSDAAGLLNFSTVIELSLQLVHAQIIWLRLEADRTLWKGWHPTTTEYDFFSPPVPESGGNNVTDQSYITQPWLSIGFGESRGIPHRPGVWGSHETRQKHGSAVELGLTLWQLASTLYEVQRAQDNNATYRGAALTETRRVQAALRQMQNVERSCGLKYARVVQMCLRASEADGLRVCRKSVRELSELRKYADLIIEGSYFS